MLRARAMAAADAEVRSGADGPAAGAGAAGGAERRGRGRRAGAPRGRAGAPRRRRARASSPPLRLRPRPGRGPGRAGRAAPGALCAGAGGAAQLGGRGAEGGGPAGTAEPRGPGTWGARANLAARPGEPVRSGRLRRAPLTFYFVPNRTAASLRESWRPRSSPATATGPGVVSRACANRVDFRANRPPARDGETWLLLLMRRLPRGRGRGGGSGSHSGVDPTFPPERKAPRRPAEGGSGKAMTELDLGSPRCSESRGGAGRGPDRSETPGGLCAHLPSRRAARW